MGRQDQSEGRCARLDGLGGGGAIRRAALVGAVLCLQRLQRSLRRLKTTRTASAYIPPEHTDAIASEM